MMETFTVKIGEDQILATPTGVSKGFYDTRNDIQGWILTSNIIESGSIKPSSEIKMHLRVFNDNRCVGACVHSTSNQCYGVCHYGRMAGCSYFCGICCSARRCPRLRNLLRRARQEVPDSVAPFVKNFNCCLLSFHGALTWGDDLMQAYYRMEALEHFAHLYTITQHIMKKQTLYDGTADGYSH